MNYESIKFIFKISKLKKDCEDCEIKLDNYNRTNSKKIQNLIKDKYLDLDIIKDITVKSKFINNK